MASSLLAGLLPLSFNLTQFGQCASCRILNADVMSCTDAFNAMFSIVTNVPYDVRVESSFRFVQLFFFSFLIDNENDDKKKLQRFVAQDCLLSGLPNNFVGCTANKQCQSNYCDGALIPSSQVDASLIHRPVNAVCSQHWYVHGMPDERRWRVSATPMCDKHLTARATSASHVDAQQNSEFLRASPQSLQ